MRRLFALAGMPFLVLATSIGIASDTPWDSNRPAYSVSAESVSLDVDEGTWMSVDVSPDGNTIVFDLLGDLYTLPIAGGTATPLTSGFAWDMQPRFSPDGKRIAFTSDRAGGDNIWTIELPSGTLHQVTFETFRMLNNPAWSPDGRYLAARKHYTTSRATGSGEIWLYQSENRDVQTGQPVVERPSRTFQKELGEPAFAADGSGIYFSQDVTPGDSFVYHQNSNAELYQIRKVSLTDGSITTVAGGAGGAARATPSADGKRIAYVKRVRSKSRLFVKDLSSGEETLVYDQLEQDMQETWAVHGVYPNMAWTPDSQSVVFWAGGKLRRIWIDSGAIEQIPFRVTDSRIVYPSTKFPVEVAPQSFDTKMIRFARRSPDGRAVLLESLGHLFVKRGDAMPVRLMPGESEGLDYSPVWSPDSRTVFFMRWDDQSLTSIRRVSAGGGKSQALVHDKGKYAELAIDPEGKTLAFRKLGAAPLFDPAWAGNPGLYLINLGDNSTTFLGNRGHRPHFGPEPDRIYAVDHVAVALGDKSTRTEGAALVSISRDGKDVRTIAHAELATDIQISPRGGHIAYQIGHQYYVTAAMATARPIPLDAPRPVFSTTRLSDVGGQFLCWSEDGKSVSWSVGPQLRTVNVADAFTDGFTPPSSGVNLSQKALTATPDSRVALLNARIITMNESRNVIASGTILVDRNRIVAVGDAAEIKVPENYERVDLAGKTIVPGFIDIHAHGPFADSNIIPQQNWHYLAHLAFGVTTVHDPANAAKDVFAAAEYAQSGRTLLPRVFSTGDHIYGAYGPPYSPVDSFEDAVAHATRLKAQGAISIKNYALPRREQRQQVIEAARRLGLNAVAEGNSLFQTDMNLITDGIVGIEHNIPTMRIYDDVMQLWRKTDVGYTPTLVVTYGGLTAKDYYIQHTDVWKHPILANFAPPQYLQANTARRTMSPESDYVDDDAAAVAKRLLDAGILVNTGGHGEQQGIALHWELWSMSRGGFTAMDALSAATINPAKYMGLDSDLGSIENGKLADLIILNRNPLEDINQTDQIDRVMLNGRLYEATTLKEEVTGNSALRPFFWQGKPQSGIR